LKVTPFFPTIKLGHFPIQILDQWTSAISSHAQNMSFDWLGALLFSQDTRYEKSNRKYSKKRFAPKLEFRHFHTVATIIGSYWRVIHVHLYNLYTIIIVALLDSYGITPYMPILTSGKQIWAKTAGAKDVIYRKTHICKVLRLIRWDVLYSHNWINSVMKYVVFSSYLVLPIRKGFSTHLNKNEGKNNTISI